MFDSLEEGARDNRQRALSRTADAAVRESVEKSL
jgi:hypothetical protein